MRVAIMTDETGWHTRQLQQALRARGAVGRCLDLADCDINTQLHWHGLALPGFGKTLPDAVIVRGIAGGSFEQVTQRLGVLHGLQALGVPVYNEARAIERSVDKSMTSLLLHQAGVPTPPTWATESTATARRILMRESAAGHAVVRKPLFGSQGKGLVRGGWIDGAHVALPDGPEAKSSADAPACGLHYLQRFVPPPRPTLAPVSDAAVGFDWRVLVIGGHAVAAMRRISSHWIHNVAQGARCEVAALTPNLARLAEAASAALAMDYAGVDLVPAAGSHPIQVIEVNGVAAWHGLQKVTPFNIARAIVDDLLDRKLRTLTPPGHRPIDGDQHLLTGQRA